MSYIYGATILDVSRSHTTTHNYSGRGLCDELITRPEESYRLWCVVVCDLETSRIGAPYIYEISNLRVNWNGYPEIFPHPYIFKQKWFVLQMNSKISSTTALKFTAGFSLFISHYCILFLAVQNIFCQTMSSEYVINCFVWPKSHLISHVLPRVPSFICFVLSAPTIDRQKRDYCYYSTPFTLISLKKVLIYIGKWLLHKVFDKLLCISYLTIFCLLISVYMLKPQLNFNSRAPHNVRFIYNLVKMSTLLLLTLQEIYGHGDSMSSWIV